MAAKSISRIFVVCLLANLCSVIAGNKSGFRNVPASSEKCPHLWTQHEDNCYMMYVIPATREIARLECEETQGALLVNILTPSEREFVLDYWDQISPFTEVIWLGLKKDSENTDDFFWDYGIELDFTDWINDEPDDNELEDCVVFVKNLGWRVHHCHNTEYPFICIKSRV